MKKSAFFSDLCFTFFVGALAFLCFLRAMYVPFSLAFVLALLCGGLCAFFAYIPLDKKRKKVVAEKKDAEKRDDFMLYLALLSDRKCAEFFQNLFLAQENNEHTFPAKIRYLNGFYALETENELFFPYFSVRPVDGDYATQILRVDTEKQKTLLCSTTAPETDRLLSRFHVRIKKADEIYGETKAKKLLPDKYPFDKEVLPKFKEKTRVWFSKKNARGFLTGGTTLLLLSLITPFPFYYRFFGFILLLLSIGVRFYGYR